MTQQIGEMSADQIEAAILAFVRLELAPPDATVDRECDLLSDLLDSVAVLRLATFVDETFGIITRAQDFVVENYQSVALIAKYVQRVRQQNP